MDYLDLGKDILFEKYTLTIAIPTYNRKEKLERTLQLLENQTTDDFIVIISDNCSNYDIYDVKNHLNSSFSNRVYISKNKSNLGMIGNICSLYEKCGSGWCWFLADDDFPRDNSVERIIQDINNVIDKSVSVLQYAQYKLDTENIERFNYIHSLEEYILYHDLENKYVSAGRIEGSIIYLSNKIFNIAGIKNYIKYAFNYANTGAPHLMPIIKGLDERMITVCMVNDIIIDYSKEQVSWNIEEIALGMSSIVDIQFDLSKELKHKLWYYTMITVRLVLRDYIKRGISNYEYLLMLYERVYKYILDDADIIFYRKLLLYSKEGMDIAYLRKEFSVT